MATAPSPNDLTRQQLDELDALLQRMLSLPLSPPEAAGPVYVPPPPLPPPAPISLSPPPATVPFAPPSSWRTDPPGVAGGERLLAHISPSPATPEVLRYPTPPRPEVPPSPPPAPAPRLVVAPPEPPPKKPLPPAFEPPAPPEPEAFELEPLAPMPVPVVETPPEPAPVPGESAPLLVAPLVLFNRGVNAAFGAIGLPGRVLRSGLVKNLLGLAGLALLVYTAAKVAEVHGWVTPPVPLPWPR